MCLGLDAFWGEDIQVRTFVGTVSEVPCLDHAFADQGLHTVVCFSQADAQGCGQLSLSYVRVAFQVTEDF